MWLVTAFQTKSWTFDYTKAHLSPDGLTGSVDGVRDGVIFRKGKPYLRISAQHIQVDVQSLNLYRDRKDAHRTHSVIRSI